MPARGRAGPSPSPISRPLTPIPVPESDQTRAVMKGNKGRDTVPEIAVRSALHSMGLRFRKNARPVKGLRCTADVVFPRERVAVFIDGCFWHSCPEHGRVPTKDRTYWSEKLERNVARDARNTKALRSSGWIVLRYWEHDQPMEIARQIRSTVMQQREEPER